MSAPPAPPAFSPPAQLRPEHACFCWWVVRCLEGSGNWIPSNLGSDVACFAGGGCTRVKETQMQSESEGCSCSSLGQPFYFLHHLHFAAVISEAKPMRTCLELKRHNSHVLKDAKQTPIYGVRTKRRKHPGSTCLPILLCCCEEMQSRAWAIVCFIKFGHTFCFRHFLFLPMDGGTFCWSALRFCICYLVYSLIQDCFELLTTASSGFCNYGDVIKC